FLLRLRLLRPRLPQGPGRRGGARRSHHRSRALRRRLPDGQAPLRDHGTAQGAQRGLRPPPRPCRQRHLTGPLTASDERTAMTALPTDQTITALLTSGLSACGVDADVLEASAASAHLPARSPITGQRLGTIAADTAASTADKIGAARRAFEAWRDVPAPARGQLVQRWGQLLGERKEELAKIITVEAGKTPSEAAGEVQEMIDICEFALGQSRQLWGKTMPSERPGHRLMETWHPLGVVGVISAFNFPVAVYSWNTALALVAGDAVVWKPSENAVLAALGAQSLLSRAAAEVGAPEDLAPVLVGGRDIGDVMVRDDRVALVSATGSVRMG